jgi:radical SAM-linked protein
LPDSAFARYRVQFSKLEDARFFGHLELASIVQRAVKRAGLTVKYSQGFNPSMRLAFDNALPVGMESEEEYFTIFLDRNLSPAAIQTALNQQLPAGLTVTNCHPAGKKQPDPPGTCVYQVQLPDGILEKNTVDGFLAQENFIVEDLTKKGRIRKTDLRQAVADITWLGSDILEIALQPFDGRHLRPTAVLKQCFGLSDPVIGRTRIKKLRQG